MLRPPLSAPLRPARREAADLYARALRFVGGLEPADRAGLLERFAGVAYFTGRGEEAAAALREAVEIHRARGDLLRQGVALRLLAKLSPGLRARGPARGVDNLRRDAHAG